jgi:hypothetical protein
LKDLACHYDGEKDTWFVRVPFALPTPALQRAKDWIFKVNHDRMVSCSPGDKKDYLKKALKALAEGRFEQLITHKGEQVIFSSTEREKPDRTFTFGPRTTVERV